MYDRKYIESLVATYLVANRRSPDKLPSDNKNDLENVRKPSKIENASTICDNCKSEVGDNFKFCPSCGKPVSEISQEVVEEIEEKPEEKVDEPFVSYGKAVHVDDDGSRITTQDSKKSREEELKEYERDYLQRTNQDEYSSPTYDQLEKPVTKKVKKKGGNSKFILIGIGVAVAIVLGGGVLFLSDSGFDGFDISIQSDIVPIATCETAKQLVKSTKVAGFPDPDKDYQYYIDRYDNEPSYQDWFHSTFPGQTVEEVLAVPTSAEAKIKISGFPDPDKDYQYYIDRYDNEPSYQDWFDSTFPGLTVYEAVC